MIQHELWTYRGIIWTSGNSVAAWVEAHTVDVRVMTFKHLTTLTSSHVPHHQRLVTALYTRHVSTSRPSNTWPHWPVLMSHNISVLSQLCTHGTYQRHDLQTLDHTDQFSSASCQSSVHSTAYLFTHTHPCWQQTNSYYHCSCWVNKWVSRFLTAHQHNSAIQCHSRWWYTLEDTWQKTNQKQTLLKLSTTQKKQTTQNTAKQN